MGSALLEIDEFDAWKREFTRDLDRPTLPKLSRARFATLVERYGDEWAPVVASIAELSVYTQNTEPRELDANAHGLAARLKDLDVLFKHVIPEPTPTTDTTQALSDADLIAECVRVDMLQNTDTPRTAVGGVNDSATIPDAIGCVRQSEPEHR